MFKKMMLLLVVFSLINTLILGSPGEEIITKSGKVRGIIQTSSFSGIRVQKFTNIPYAEAPVGELRFEKPQPRKPWNGTLNSTEKIIACIQPRINPARMLTEDCLILNVWTPYPCRVNMSVMVWIHGGAYRHGVSGEYVGANIVAIGEVIVATINYRLSALGFLTTGDGRMKGNIGLYDQRLAMKWVKENIASFGGNPESITLFGESAGGASVSAHTLSPGSWPYFDQAILQSGCMLNPWGVMSDSELKQGLQWFLGMVGCGNNEKLLECLRNVTVDQLKEVLGSNDVWTKRIAPSLDREFIPDHPGTLWEKGKVKSQNVILGVNKDEMFLYLSEMLKYSKNVTFYLKHFEKSLKQHFKNSSQEVYEKARELYMPKCLPDYLEALKPSVAFETDRIFVCGMIHEANLRSKLFNASNVYLYQYSHAPLVDYDTWLYPYGAFGFAGHGLDVTSTFGTPINNSKFLPDDQTLSMRMILYWTNFAKTGDPNVGTTKLPMFIDNVRMLPTWPQHTIDDKKYLDMGSFSQMLVEKNLREKQCEFLMGPEEFINKEVTSGEAKVVLKIYTWFVTAAVSSSIFMC